MISPEIHSRNVRTALELGLNGNHSASILYMYKGVHLAKVNRHTRSAFGEK